MANETMFHKVYEYSMLARNEYKNGYEWVEMVIPCLLCKYLAFERTRCQGLGVLYCVEPQLTL